MSRLRDIIIDIQEHIEQNVLSYEEISRLTETPIKVIYEIAESLNYQEPMYEY